MARLYTNYLNNGREGCTWATLVAITLDCSPAGWVTCRQVAEAIWDRKDPPASLLSQVNAALDKLIDNKLAAYRRNQGQPDGSRWEYSLTGEGAVRFGGQSTSWEARDHTDSKLFQPNPKKTAKRRNNVVRFRSIKRRA